MCPTAARTADGADNAAIVATNDSSIVSKRSVEKLYVADRRDHLLRYFVPKFQRRSPLINRGYWLRMRLIRKAVEAYLHEGCNTPKHVVNLGCGFDPLPFYYTRDFPRINFIDIDFPESINRKCEIIRNTPELLGRLKDHKPPGAPTACSSIVFASANYVAAGIDMSKIDKLEELLCSVCERTDQFLFISEVAITYMPVKDADALIQWAQSFPSSRFALIEQILPAGPKHPFASTMLSHFQKINSPLRNIGTYPTIPSQVKRFQDLGWTAVDAYDLYGAWCNLVPEDEKRIVDSIEAFDECEDFALFGQHYLYLYAGTTSSMSADIRTGIWSCGDRWGTTTLNSIPDVRKAWNDTSPDYEQAEAHFASQNGTHTFNIAHRKFGAASSAELDATTTLYYGGIDGKTRSSSVHIFDHTLGKTTQLDLVNGPSPRACHTLTKLAGKKVLMIGGRGSPDAAYADCWLFTGTAWRQVQDLPTGRYRHSAVYISLNGEDHVIVFGGKCHSRHVYDSWLLWSEASGWREIQVTTPAAPQGRFSTSMTWFPATETGLLIGGFRQDGSTFSDIWTWSLVPGPDPTMPYDRIELNCIEWQTSSADDCFLSRGGSQMVSINDSQAMLCGGISGKQCFTSDFSRCFLLIDNSKKQLVPLSVEFHDDEEAKRPILSGFSCVWRESQLEIFCGGIIAFSMGAFWNRGHHILRLGSKPIENKPSATLTLDPTSISTTRKPAPVVPNIKNHSEQPRPVVKFRAGDTQTNIRDATKQEIPLLLEGFSFGKCVEFWSPDYLKSTIGDSREVIVHKIDDVHMPPAGQSYPIHMNFNSKNFVYTRLPFSEFIDISFSKKGNTPPCYLRSISNKPTKYASLLEREFPEIASDFSIPPELAFIAPSLHSSILRISSAGVGVWLHYDVCANVLFHIKGRKRILLFPPTDISKLQFPPGKTTSSIENIFENIPSGTHPLEVVMCPGEALYLPPFWLHAVLPLEPCIAVNTFFHSFDASLFSEGKDLYGNKDLACYQEGRNALREVLAKFDGLEDSVRRFYISRLGQELLERATE
ncbi:tRNA methyltransferase ppm2 [Orbilia brochopaga]|uniref:tRNA wybutosine-synthesizing protein 4 n=1 Tax=Orbilia brochopaga TaxID=3140254 RepID=A0AAV9U403_9PEZI